MLPGMEDWKNLKDEWGGKCLSLHQRAAYLVWSPILSIYHFFRDSINEGPFSEHERERAVTLLLHPERQGLFNDVIWACLGASLCHTCPFHSPNHLPLWFFFLKLFNRLRHPRKLGLGGEKLFEMLHWPGVSSLQPWHGKGFLIGGAFPIQLGSRCQSGQCPLQLWLFFLSLHNDSMTLWDKGARLMVKLSALTWKGTEFAGIKGKLCSANDRLVQMDACQIQSVPWWGHRMSWEICG